MVKEFSFVWAALYLTIFVYLFARSWYVDHLARKRAKAVFHNKVSFVSAVADDLADTIDANIKIDV